MELLTCVAARHHDAVGRESQPNCKPHDLRIVLVDEPPADGKTQYGANLTIKACAFVL